MKERTTIGRVERIKIKELWVPAAAILEENLKDDARLVRAEARHRVRHQRPWNSLA